MVPVAGLDPAMTRRGPELTAAETLAVAQATFGIEAAAAENLGSERDQAVMLLDPAGARIAVMKISNPAEQPATLDMEAEVVDHALQVDPGLPLVAPIMSPVGGSARMPWSVGSAVHWVRMYPVVPGRGRGDPRSLDDGALVAWGEMTARLGRATRGFAHPSAIRRLPWDVREASACRPMAAHIDDADLQAMVVAVLDQFDESLGRRMASLRHQVIHGDLTIDNTLIDDAGRIAGIIDFGDMTHTALLFDVSSALDTQTWGRVGEERFRAARLLVGGYQRRTPLEPEELGLVGEAWAARTAIGVAIGAWRAAVGLEDPDFATRYFPAAADALADLLGRGWRRLAGEFGDPREPAGEAAGVGGPPGLGLDPRLPPPARPSAVSGKDPATPGDERRGGANTGSGGVIERREAVFGPAMEPLSYAEPIEVVGASGVWLDGVDGRRYLDLYNNVPCVGHAHPRVVAAATAASRRLSTNMRYLDRDTIRLAERLISTCPADLDTVMFVNSGSEANDLAWRMATTATGHTGGLCTSFAYHGVTTAIAALSPEITPQNRRPGHVETWAPPDAYRSTSLDPAEFAAAIGRLADRGHRPAVAVLDGVLQSDGVLLLEPAYVQACLAHLRAAGGLWIADEVQGGFGRTGGWMWSFERFGITPDFVTLGKPMGNGFPIGAVITRRGIATEFARSSSFFSTFAGNQPAVAAAHAVLDVLADERVLDRTVVAGDTLRGVLGEGAAGHAGVGDVRGIGLANAVEIVDDPVTKSPDPGLADRLKQDLRRRGLLVGTTGPHGNVLKVRPPLAFTAADAALVAAPWAAALAATAGR